MQHTDRSEQPLHQRVDSQRGRAGCEGGARERERYVRGARERWSERASERERESERGHTSVCEWLCVCRRAQRVSVFLSQRGVRRERSACLCRRACIGENTVCV
eukprot:3091071-Rhodomonas_salina.1